MDTINIGTAGQRVEIVGSVVSEKMFGVPNRKMHTHGGPAFFEQHRIEVDCEDGTRAVWLASSRQMLQKGDAVTLRGTIDGYRHEDDGHTRVYLQRCKIMEDVLTLV